jgi:hypothetical protein
MKNGQTEQTIAIVRQLRELTAKELAYVLEGVDDICMEAARLDERGANENRYRAAANFVTNACVSLRNID